MPPSTLLTALALAHTATAYTQVNLPTPYMLKNIDPIVFPGSYSQSHLHSIFGSDALTASTNTSAALQQGCTNADNPNDLSAYWVPTPLYTTDGGATWAPIGISRFSAYYNLGEGEAEVAIPQDLQMVAGVSSAAAEADMDANAGVQWFCEGEETTLDANGFPSEGCSTHLQQLLYFPQCVNEATHEVAYKTKRKGDCPDGMKSMPQLRFSVRWDTRKVLPDGWSGEAPLKLACGPAWCSHGDFINGWTEEAATNMIETTKSGSYARVEGALGTEAMDCTPADAEPDQGTSDYAESVSLMSKRDVSSFGWFSRSRFVRA